MEDIFLSQIFSLPQIYFLLQRGCVLDELVDKIFLNDVVDNDFPGDGKHDGHFSVTYIFLVLCLRFIFRCREVVS